MIKNLIVNGCSFTELPKGSNTLTWADVVAKHLNVELYKNIAMGGAGNKYIAHSTIDLLEHEQLNSEETLVLIMWSGISRKDVRITEDWWNHIQNNGYPYGAQFALGQYPDNEYTYWVFSGGQASSWLSNSAATEIFKNEYKISDATIMCRESLEHFNLLGDYLAKNKYQHRFMSFINYWNTPDAIVKGGEYSLNQHCSSMPMYKNFDFSKWIFTDENNNSLGEYALSTNQYDSTMHPTDTAYLEYAEKFIIPSLKDFL